jgi:prepilin-type N-terminal cleavage/methylation domain-containing protein
MKKNRGFTLVELMIVVAIIGPVLVLIGWFTFRGCTSNEGSAEEEARKYGMQLGLEVKGVSCTNRDTDGDGYVSCSISHNENGKLSIMPVECAVKFGMNSGCKAQKIGVGRGSIW